MNVQINKLVRSLLQKDSLEQCTLHELQELARRYPYFGAAQLLLAKKLSTVSGGNSEDETRYREQVQTTSLFFHDPLWLDHLLNDTGQAVVLPGESLKEIQEHSPDQKVELIEFPADNELENSEVIVPDQNQADQPIKIAGENTASADMSIRDETEPVSRFSAFRIEPVDPLKTELLFEPYHTVDYFASQGIKFKEEEQPMDKFGKQLKSFTEWLKTMKRLPVSELAKAAEPQTVQKVEQLAAHSLEDREVITEAMAEVWEKQGNALKAIEIYSKLSLLEPSKSAYFAAKIEELKKIN